LDAEPLLPPEDELPLEGPMRTMSPAELLPAIWLSQQTIPSI
jgi:hypothetical protein